MNIAGAAYAVFIGTICAFLLIGAVQIAAYSYGEKDFRAPCREHGGTADVELTGYMAPTIYVAIVTCRDGTVEGVR